MDIVLFLVSLLVISLVSSIVFLVLTLGFFTVTKKIFNMNEDKWSTFFEYKNGKGFYFSVFFPYVVTMILSYPLSLLWFTFIQYEHKTLGSLLITLLLIITGLFKFYKIKKDPTSPIPFSRT